MESKAAYMILFICIGSVLPYPTGVPNTPEVCQNMTPGHGGSVQATKSPYTVEASPRRASQGDTVQVVLSGSQPFKGFYVQARTLDGTPIGSFMPTGSIKAHNCGDGKNNAAFHSRNDRKEQVEVFWKAPRDYAGQVIFTSSFVSEFEQYWTRVQAQPITIKA